MELFQHKENNQDLYPLWINAYTVGNIHEQTYIMEYYIIAS